MITEKVEKIYVRIINGKIAELNTFSSDIELPAHFIGTSLDKLLYKDDQFIIDPDWNPIQESPPEDMSAFIKITPDEK